MPLSLQIAIGILLGFGALRVLDYLIELPAKLKAERQHRQFHEEMKETVGSFIDDMHADMMKEREAAAAKAAKRRKPAAKKPVTKKGVSNAKATTKRSSAARRS